MTELGGMRMIPWVTRSDVDNSVEMWMSRWRNDLFVWTNLVSTSLMWPIGWWG